MVGGWWAWVVVGDSHGMDKEWYEVDAGEATWQPTGVLPSSDERMLHARKRD